MPRILITTNHLRERRGSEIVTFELAEEFADRGWHVDVYTNLFLPPMADRFRELASRASVRVAEDPYEDFGLDYDLIWVQHSLLPPSIIRRLGEREAAAPIVWHHMSPIIEIDQPLVAEIENRLADVTSFISERTRETLEAFGLDRPSQIFANPAPRSFVEADTIAPVALRRLAVVSNHPPAELREAAEALAEAGVETVFIGEPDGSVEVTPRLLAGFDAVVTIGKTVQYALVMGLPVFVYDHFGGEGWLRPETFEVEAAANFSGRSTSRRISAEALVDELLLGFEHAVAFVSEQRPAFRARYSLQRSVDAVLERAELRSPRPKRLSHGEVLRWLALSEQLRGMYRTLEHLQDRLAESESSREAAVMAAGAETAIDTETEAEQTVEADSETETETETGSGAVDGSIHVIAVSGPDTASRRRMRASLLQQTVAADLLSIVRTDSGSRPVEEPSLDAFDGIPVQVVDVAPEHRVLESVNERISSVPTEFVVVHDGYGAWHPRFLEYAIEHLEANPRQVGVVFDASRGVEVQINDVVLDAQNPLAVSRVPGGPGVVLDLLAQAGANCTPYSTFVVRRSAAICAGLFDPVLAHSADWDFGLRVLHCGPIGVADTPVPFVTLYERGATDSMRAARAELAGKAFRMDPSARLLYSAVVTTQGVFGAAEGREVLGRLGALEEELRNLPRLPPIGFELRVRNYLGRLPARVRSRVGRSVRGHR
ncbi:hypothetical protein [Agromyces sp. PvR057]|uniref:hypothetical protein n=1 Tax=Agromyces sp. PvR057 TaxID=3156403 RepID=UPI0033955B22